MKRLSIQSDLRHLHEALEKGEQQQLVRADTPSRVFLRSARGTEGGGRRGSVGFRS